MEFGVHVRQSLGIVIIGLDGYRKLHKIYMRTLGFHQYENLPMQYTDSARRF